MFNQISKVVSVGFASTLVLAVTAHSAQAYDFDFNFDVGNHVSNGTLRFNSGLTLPTNSASSSELIDWEINITNTSNSNTTTFYGDGNGFGADNSNLILDFPPVFNVSNTEVSLASGELCISVVTTCDGGNGLFLANKDNGRRVGKFLRTSSADSFSREDFPTDSGFIAFASAPTPVPFGVNGDLSLMVLGGLYGVSRLRKKFAASK